MTKKRKPGKKAIIRIIALLMCILLAGMAVYASLATFAYAGDISELSNADTRIDAAYDARNEAFIAMQSTRCHNDTGGRLTQLPFAVNLNSLKRSDALTAGPGGVEIYQVSIDGVDVPWAFSLDERRLLVECDIAPGETVSVEFRYSVLLPEARGFAGYGDMGARLSFFYPAVLMREGDAFEDCPISDVCAVAYLPEQSVEMTVIVDDDYTVVAGVEPISITPIGNGVMYAFYFGAARDVSIAIGRRYSEYRGEVATAYTNNAAAARTALDACDYAYWLFNKKLGYCVFHVDIVQVDLDEDVEAQTGAIWLSSDLIASGGDIERAVVEGLARQYFTQSLIASPIYEPWLNEAVASYLACLYYYERYGKARFLDMLNYYALDAVSLTIPGGLAVDSELSLFRSRDEFNAVARGRGVAVLNEIRHAVGFDGLWEALEVYYREHEHSVATAFDFARALESAHGAPLDSLLADTLSSIGEYINQMPERLD